MVNGVKTVGGKPNYIHIFPALNNYNQLLETANVHAQLNYQSVRNNDYPIKIYGAGSVKIPCAPKQCNIVTTLCRL